MRDLNTIYSFKSVINNSLTLLVSMGASQLKEDYYWSSTEYNRYDAWDLTMNNGSKYGTTKDGSSSYVRPVLAF